MIVRERRQIDPARRMRKFCGCASPARSATRPCAILSRCQETAADPSMRIRLSEKYWRYPGPADSHPEPLIMFENSG